MNAAGAMQESDLNHDAFPTRNGGPERLIERTDPVIWGGSRDCVYLDDYERESFEEKGFLIKRNLFSDEEVGALGEAAQELRSAAPGSFGGDAVREPEGNALRTLFRLERHSDLFNTVIRSERIAGIARSILDDEVYIYQSRLNNKPGFQGNGFYWHSDFETWHAEDGMPHMRALSASILLTDNDMLNGPLMLMPGSHKTFVGCAGETPDNNFEHSLQPPERQALLSFSIATSCTAQMVILHLLPAQMRSLSTMRVQISSIAPTVFDPPDQTSLQVMIQKRLW